MPAEAGGSMIEVCASARTRRTERNSWSCRARCGSTGASFRQASVVAVGVTTEGDRQVLGHRCRPLRGPGVLDGVSPQLGEVRAEERGAGDLRCAR